MTDTFTDFDVIEHKDLRVVEKLLEIKKIRMSFAIDHHLNTRGEKLNFTHYPHIRELYETVARDIVLQGSVQSLKSEWAIVDHFAAAYTGISIFFVVPKYETRTTYVQNRVNKCVENVPEYKKIIGVGFFDSVALKSFGKGTIKYTGSNVLADFREYPADMIIIDEVDECNQDNIEYALDRLRASPYQFKRYIGNPKFEGKGINHYFKMSDQREWTIPCKECGQYTEIDWFETVVKEILDREGNVVDYRLRDTEWHEGCGRDVFMICPLCGGELHRGSFNGKWIVKQPENAVTGYHISMMCSLINSISGMWNRFQKAANDPARMQQFYNSDLGLPYSAVGNRVTESILDNCVGDYNLVTKPDCAHIADDEHVGPCSMGIDVGGNFDVRVSYIEARGRRKLVYIGKVKNIDELHSIIERYNVEKCVVDSMPESVLVQEFQEEAACDVWLCSYRKSEGTDRRMNYDSNHRMITVDRTEALDRSFAQLRKGFNILPKNYGAVLDGAYLSEMCMPVRKISSDDKGRQFCEWTRGKDHQRHCDTYDMLAAIMITESIIDEVLIG